MNIISIAIICTSFIYSPDGTNAVGGLRLNLPQSLIGKDKHTRMEAGWYDFTGAAPICESNEVCVCTGFRRFGEDFTGVYATHKQEPVSNALKYSVRSIIRELRSINKYADVRVLLEKSGYDWEFVGSNYLASDDEDFIRMCSAIVESGILSKPQLENLLPKCIWKVD